MAPRLTVPDLLRPDVASVCRSYLDNPAEKLALNRLVGAHGTSQNLFARARMILLAPRGTGVGEIAPQLGVWLKTIRHWLYRWRIAVSAPSASKTTVAAKAVAQRLAE